MEDIISRTGPTWRTHRRSAEPVRRPVGRRDHPRQVARQPAAGRTVRSAITELPARQQRWSGPRVR